MTIKAVIYNVVSRWKDHTNSCSGFTSLKLLFAARCSTTALKSKGCGHASLGLSPREADTGGSSFRM